MKLSFDQLQGKLNSIINKGSEERNRWVREVFEDRFIYFDSVSQLLFEAPYTIDINDNVSILSSLTYSCVVFNGLFS